LAFLVSGLKAMLYQANESEEKYRNLFESSSNAIFIYDPATMNILDVNSATSTTYGYRKDELIGMPYLKLSADRDASSVTFEKRQKHDKSNVADYIHRGKMDLNFQLT